MLSVLYVILVVIAAALTLLLTANAATIHRQDPAGQGIILGAGVLNAIVLGGVMAAVARIAWGTFPGWLMSGTFWAIPLIVLLSIGCLTILQQTTSIILLALTMVPAFAMLAVWTWCYFRG